MLKKIESLNQEFSNDKSLPVQDFFLLKAMEKEAVMDVKRKLNLPKARAVGIACQLLLERLEEEEKQDDKGKEDEKK